MSFADVRFHLQNPPTCLSPSVLALISDSWEIASSQLQGANEKEDEDNKFINEDGTLDWNTLLQTTLKNLDISSTPEDYQLCIGRLVPMCVQCHDWICQITEGKFSELYSSKFTWTAQWQVFLECFRLLKSSNNVDGVLSLLLCTAALERALGDVYLVKNSPCPFLLKDLLATNELREIFGEEVIFCLRILIGPPSSLNLRNVTWHGFAAPNEIPKQYASFLLVFAASLNDKLQTLTDQHTLTHRQPFQLSHFQLCQEAFPAINMDDIDEIQQLFNTTDFILPIMQEYWQVAVSYYANGRYGLCCVLLLPQLENSLRRLFCAVNRCPERVLTAESSVFYTTFDEILSPTLPNGEINMMAMELGDSYMEMLLDMFVCLEGPRVRDHISHGEVEVLGLCCEVADHLLSICMAFCLKYSKREIRELSEGFISVGAAAENYRSSFHPVAYLRRSLRRLSGDLGNLVDLPEPDAGSPDECVANHVTKSGLGSHKKLQNIAAAVLKNSAFSDATIQDSHSERSSVPLDFLQSLVLRVSDLAIRTLFQTRAQLEVVSLLRRVVAQGLTVVEQVSEIGKARFHQWKNKQLRSRQRNNYWKFLKSVPVLFVGLWLVALVTIRQLSSISSVKELDSRLYQKLLKYLKGSLQYVENLSTLTSPEKNKWDESCKVTEDFVERTEIFYSS